MIQPTIPPVQPDLDPHVQSTLQLIDDTLIRSPAPEDFFPEFDRIAADLIQYDRLAITFYVNRRFQVKYAYASGTAIENFEQGSIKDISEETARKWISRKKSIHANGNNGVFQPYNELARSVDLYSVIIAPIRWRGESIGDLILRSRKEEAYTDRDLTLIDMLANKISGVVANAQAVSHGQLESTLRESLLELSRLVSSVGSLHEIQDQFGEIACSLLGADRVAIAVPGEIDQIVENVLVYGHEIAGHEIGSRTHDYDFDNIPWLQTESPYHAEETTLGHSPTAVKTERAVSDSGLNSTLVAPIVWHRKAIGALTFRARATKAFNKYHLETAAAIANQVAGAIANQIAYEEIRRVSRTRESLVKISRVISSSKHIGENVDELGKLITDLIPSDRLAIAVTTAPGIIPRSVFEYGVSLDGLAPNSVLPLTGDLHRRLLRDPVPLVIDSTNSELSADYAISARFAEPVGLKSWMVAPLIWREQLLGIVNFRSKREHAFGQAELDLAGQVAHQIAGSIAGNIAYMQLETEAKTRGVLARIGTAISSSLSLDDSFESFAKLVSELIPVDRLAITLVPGPDDPTIILKHYGKPLKGMGLPGNPLMRAELNSMLARDRVPLILDDLAPGTLEDLPRSFEIAALSGLRSWMVAPLLWSNQMLGILHFRSSEPDAYNESHLELAQQVATQISNFVANYIAFQKLKDEATIRDVLAELSNAVGSSDNLATVLPQIEMLTGSVITFDGITIGTYDAKRELFHHLYSGGLRASVRSDQWVFKISDVIAGDAIKAGEVQSVSIGSIDEIRHRPRSRETFEAGTRSFLTAPLISNDRVVGAIQLRSTTENAYGDEHVRLLKRIADQFAGAFANSLATEQVRLQAAALESADNAIVITDAEGIIEWVNPAFIKMYGWSSDEVIGQHTAIMQSSDPADLPTNDRIWKALGQGRSWNGTHISRKKDGTEFPEEITVTPVFNQDGETTHLIGIKQDITERVQAEQAQRDTIRIESENRELQRIAAARSEFLSTVSHELRTPLTTVSAFADILFKSHSENLTDRQKTHIGLIRKSSAQLASLIDDLLDVSQADSGRLVMQKAKFGLVEMVDEVADLSRVLLSARNQTLELTNLDSPVYLDADRSRIIQILTNLLTNASKFSSEDSTISLGVTRDAGHVTFTVTDHGQGITKADQLKMFSPFYRGSNPGAAATIGSGLGLSVVQSLVDLHDGAITVKSKRGKGTAITVVLPDATGVSA